MTSIKFTDYGTGGVPSDITAAGIGKVTFTGYSSVTLLAENANTKLTTGSLRVSDFPTFQQWCRTQLYDVTLNSDQTLTYSRPGVDSITIGTSQEALNEYAQKVVSGYELLGMDAILLHPWGILVQNPQYSRTFVIDC